MKLWQTMIAVVITSAVTALLVTGVWGGRSGVSSQQSTYDRVLASGTIRCGYVPYPPGLVKDANTGKISGVFAETVEAAANNLNLKVEWTEEVGWGSMIEGLNANRYDMICSPVWQNSSRARVADFTTPLFYSGIGAYVRTDDNRFAADLGTVNASGVRISTIDGEMSAIIATDQFSKAQKVSLPQTSDGSLLLLNVADRKADITFVEPYIADQFLKSHPGTVKNLIADRPIRVFPNTMMYRKGQTEFGNMMNGALAELVNSGQVDRLLTQYAGTSRPFYPVARPYDVPSAQ